jgi:hypothetical protein
MDYKNDVPAINYDWCCVCMSVCHLQKQIIQAFCYTAELKIPIYSVREGKEDGLQYND